jgi:hypothetical protein
MLKGKKGVSATYWMIIALVLVAMVTATFFVYIKDVKEDTYFQKTFVSKDLALLLNKIQSSPGNVQYHYFQENFKTSDFDFSFDKNYVGIYTEGSKNYKVGSPFFYNTFITNNLNTIDSPNNLFIVKDDKTISFTDRESAFMQGPTEKCDIILNQEHISKQQPKKIVLITTQESAVLTASIVEQLDPALFTKKEIITKKDALGYDLSTVTMNDDIVLEIVMQSENVLQDELTVNYGRSANQNDAKYFACLLHNTLTQSNTIDGKGIALSTDTLLNKNINGVAARIHIITKTGSTIQENQETLANQIIPLLEGY